VKTNTEDKGHTEKAQRRTEREAEREAIASKEKTNQRTLEVGEEGLEARKGIDTRRGLKKQKREV
jgi:hypothetical protein